MLTLDGYQGGFGSLDQSQIDRVNSVVSEAQASAAQASALVPGIVSSLWADAIGAGSSASALQSNALAAQNEYQTIQARAASILADPLSNESDVQGLEQAIPSLSNTAAQQAAALLSPTAAVQAVGAGFKNPFGIPLAVWGSAAAALAAIYVWLQVRRRS